MADMRSLIISGPFSAASYMPEAARPQFATGPQKCVVMGPVGELMKAANAMAARL